ncbi:RuBisCO large subunit C-terminal-like domain-containing protein [Fodinibius salsisoli]|uniref:Ribulose bisphosphate carboxylase large subunit C-terminal domain-containing protein n=1 Tax=Fodinibius salsisoli TaxID=2820877 RepID=A0ABT3PME6_9BACT|nr:RuBisCO large subunit C-terminal-like domain-containing protein [Fodinibius salsisoli]MCW9707120.1 hypothetical protein [Fodinibius salsisoli]
MATFAVTYLLAVQKGEGVDKKIEQICLEQSAELPRKVLSKSIIDEVVGRPRGREQVADGRFKVVIEWPLANIGKEDIIQFLNLLYGNVSLQPGIQVVDVEWSALSEFFAGPQFGIEGIRSRYQITGRPMSATALKPLGSSSQKLADLAQQFARGGIDIIKDDHGIMDQKYAPFEERLTSCVSTLKEVAQKRGRKTYYFPNITAEAWEAEERYLRAAELGADGVLICPHITGLATMHRLARREEQLPIMAHPAFSGQLTMNELQGFAPSFLYGQLWRALGADFVIYPNTGGRFSYSLAQCKAINNCSRSSDLPFSPSWPTPAGGISVEKVRHWRNEYGPDTCLLIGGSLYKYAGGPEEAAKVFSKQLID